MVDDMSRLPNQAGLPAEVDMSLADLGFIVGAVVILGAVGFFLYTKSLKH